MTPPPPPRLPPPPPPPQPPPPPPPPRPPPPPPPSPPPPPPPGPPRPRRDRHGRGLRGRLVPAEVPLARSRAEQFDDLVLDAVEDIERRWERELAGVEFAVEDVPWVEHTSPDEVVLDPDVLD